MNLYAYNACLVVAMILNVEVRFGKMYLLIKVTYDLYSSLTVRISPNSVCVCLCVCVCVVVDRPCSEHSGSPESGPAGVCGTVCASGGLDYAVHLIQGTRSE